MTALPRVQLALNVADIDAAVDFYGRLFDMPAAVRKQRIQELISMVGLDRAKRRQLKEYSKGMTRRIGLAQALILPKGLSPILRCYQI